MTTLLGIVYVIFAIISEQIDIKKAREQTKQKEEKEESERSDV